MARKISGRLSGLSLRDLEYAVTVGELHHFGKAARHCGVTQSGLSEQVRKLEDLLGVVLFERSHRQVVPTARGAEILRQAERILAEARGLMETAAAIALPLTGVLRLGAIATLAPYYMPHILRPVRMTFPALALSFAEGRDDGLIEQLQCGNHDALLLAMPPPPSLSHELLFFEPFRLVCLASHPLARKAEPSLDTLDAEELILLEEGHCLREQTLSLCRLAQLGSRTRQATSLEMLWHMVAAGEGYSLFPLLALQGREAMSDIISTIGLADPTVGRRIGLAWRASDPRGAEFAQFAQFLRANLPPGLKVLRPPSAGDPAPHSTLPRFGG